MNELQNNKLYCQFNKIYTHFCHNNSKYYIACFFNVKLSAAEKEGGGKYVYTETITCMSPIPPTQHEGEEKITHKMLIVKETHI